MRIENTKFYSKKIGNLAKGCRYCVRGEKLVLFVTGLCPRKCYYCPISDKKYLHDVTYANEWPTDNIKEIIAEAKLCDSKGAGFTGGDPLVKIDRTIHYITALKKTFGKKFHIHLYTSFDMVDEKKMRRLFDSGLDEIRFHAEIDNEKLWDKILIANKFKWDIGIEIPVIPGKLNETKKLIDYFYDKVDFVNLNELEIADNQMSQLLELGFMTKDRISYAVKGSEETALKLMNYVLKKEYKINIHFCTAKLKDKVQMAKRIKRRAKNAAKAYDVVDKEGILTRGAIYSDNLAKVVKALRLKFDVPDKLIEEDEVRGRVLTGAWVVDELRNELKRLGFRIAIVEEYPTWDCLPISAHFL